MTGVSFKRDKKGDIIKLQVKGHAGFDEEGLDIVCSAVSGIVFTAVKGIREYLKIRGKFTRKKGFMVFEMPPGKVSSHSQAIMETALLGLKELSEKYPEHLSVKETH